MDDFEIPNMDVISNPLLSGESLALLAEFKLNLNDYLNNLIVSPVRSLSDIITFNQNNPDLVSLLLFDAGNYSFTVSSQCTF